MNLIKHVVLCGALALSGCYDKGDVDSARKACLDLKGEVRIITNNMNQIYEMRCEIDNISYRVNRSNEMVDGKVVN